MRLQVADIVKLLDALNEWTVQLLVRCAVASQHFVKSLVQWDCLMVRKLGLWLLGIAGVGAMYKF